MPLRLLEVTVPVEGIEQIPTLLKDVQVVQLEMPEPAGATGLVRLLVDAEDTETVSDQLVSHYGARHDFRLILLRVEATLPVVEIPKEIKEASSEEAEVRPERAQRISREELYENIAQASKLTRVYVILVALSTVVASVGLLRGDVAIIIGAMVIAPLLGPNVGLALAVTLGDPELAKRSLKVIGVGVALAVLLSLLLGVVLTVNPSSPELAARTGARVSDIVVALAAGAAGTLAFTSGVPSVVVGVMVAVALLPPLVAAGLLAGSGHGRAALGAVVLLLTNVTCINLAAVATFLLQKVRPRTWWETERARKATRRAAIAWIVLLVLLFLLMLLGHAEGG